MHRLLLMGLNHVTAPLAVRERLAFDAQQQRAALERFASRYGPGHEMVLLSTCNRVELYIGHAGPRSLDGSDIARFIGECRGVPPTQFRGHLYEQTGRGAVAHLFNVAASLDSMVLGESQILGQVRHAYDVSREMGLAGAMLHALFQRAIAAGREVMSQTPLGDGRLSVAGVAVAYARRIFESFTDKHVLCIGAGKMSSLVLQHFVGLHPRRLLICNRDIEKARGLAARFAGEAVSFNTLEGSLALSDIVITSTGAQHPIITQAQVQRILKQRRYRPIVLIDIAVPRDVEAAVGENEHVYLYNIDDLQSVVSATQAQRTDAAGPARDIVSRHVADFLAQQRQRAMGPAIHQLYQRSHAIAREELEHALARLTNLTDADRADLRELTRRIVNKLLHDPIAAMRDGNYGETAAEDEQRQDPPTSAA